MVEAPSRSNPALWFRYVLRKLFHNSDLKVPDNDSEFYDFLERLYLEEKDYPGSDPFLVALYATGLMTYGRLDVVDDALEGMLMFDDQHIGGSVHREQALQMAAMLPMPIHQEQGYYMALRDVPILLPSKSKVREWLDEHRSRLRWDETPGRFVLEE